MNKPPRKTSMTMLLPPSKRGKGIKIQQKTNSIGENEERGSYEKQIYCAKS